MIRLETVSDVPTDWSSLARPGYAVGAGADWTSLRLYEMVSDDSREHPGERASTLRLRGPAGYCYLKTYPDRAQWEGELHAYERWAPAFGDRAPRLLGVKEDEPYALLISELPGRVLEEVALAASVEREVWRRAGQALAVLHALPAGRFFGRCQRDGTPAGPSTTDPVTHVTAEFDDWTQRGGRVGCLDMDELAAVQDARELIPTFAGERPTPSHRDYCPANWLIDDAGAWAGVIDYEFAYWDVRAADFSRYPAWEWIERPDLPEALLDGYAQVLAPPDARQLLAGRALYALGAIVWGSENDYPGFAAEGRQALRRVGALLG